MKQIMRQFLNICSGDKELLLSILNFFYLENNEILIACPDHVWIMWRLLHVPRHPRVLSLEISFVMLICFIISFKTSLDITNKSAPVSFNIHAKKRSQLHDLLTILYLKYCVELECGFILY